MKTIQVMIVALAAAALSAPDGCNRNVGKDKSVTTQSSTINLSVNGQAYATVHAKPNQTIVWTEDHLNDSFEIVFQHTQPCAGQTALSIVSDKKGQVTCTLPPSNQPDVIFMYSIVVHPDGDVAQRVVDCGSCPINSGNGPNPGPGGSPTPPTRNPNTNQTSPTPMQNPTGPGIAFSCGTDAPILDSVDPHRVPISTLPTARIWIPNGFSSKWKVHFVKSSPCLEGPDIISDDRSKFRCRVTLQTPADYTYTMQADACGKGSSKTETISVVDAPGIREMK